MRDSFNLQGKINEAKTLGPEGVKTDLIQKLSFSALPGEDQLSVLRQTSPDRANASKGKSAFIALLAAPSPKKEAAPAPAPAPAQFANVYRDTKGFAAVG
jgi:hypothetical protein